MKRQRRRRLRIRKGRLLFLGCLTLLALVLYHDNATAMLLLGSLDVEVL